MPERVKATLPPPFLKMASSIGNAIYELPSTEAAAWIADAEKHLSHLYGLKSIIHSQESAMAFGFLIAALWFKNVMRNKVDPDLFEWLRPENM